MLKVLIIWLSIPIIFLPCVWGGYEKLTLYLELKPLFGGVCIIVLGSKVVLLGGGWGSMIYAQFAM